MSNHQEIKQIIGLLREQSTQSILLHAFIAERLGLNPTDLKALDVIMKSDGITAGKLAEATRLTTGAITGVIDRLEKAGFVRRAFDIRDRRRVLIQVMPEIQGRLAPIFNPLHEQMRIVLDKYTTTELALIKSFLEYCIDAVKSTKFESGPVASGNHPEAFDK